MCRYQAFGVCGFFSHYNFIQYFATWYEKLKANKVVAGCLSNMFFVRTFPFQETSNSIHFILFYF